jgi:hypothetical protein
MPEPRENTINRGSTKAERSNSGPAFRGGERLVQHKRETRQQARQTKADTRTAQPKPIEANSFCNKKGKTIPPRLDPVTAKLDAVARRRTK